MINQMAERIRGASLSMLSPGFLIDRFLDQIEKLSGMIVPAQADKLSCEETRIEAFLDQFAA
jgi:hypothetical protein